MAPTELPSHVLPWTSFDSCDSFNYTTTTSTSNSNSSSSSSISVDEAQQFKDPVTVGIGRPPLSKRKNAQSTPKGV